MSEPESEKSNSNNRRYYIAGAILVIALGYWFGFKPYQDKKYCYNTAKERSQYEFSDGFSQERFDRIYANCTKAKGL